MLKLFNKVVYGTRVHQNTWGRVSQAWNRVWKRDEEVQNLCNFSVYLTWMLADVQTNYGSSSVHAQWFSC